MWKYPDEVHEFIAKNVSGQSINDLIELTNKEMKTEFTDTKMRSYLKNHGLKTGIKPGNKKGHSRIYPPEIKSFIFENFKGTGHQDMADLLNQTFGSSYTKGQIKGFYARFKLNSGITGHFHSDQVPWNKGKPKTWEGGEDTQFKKGHRPHNWVPIGSERITKDGYIQVKIQEGKFQYNWRGKHILIWEEKNGPLPEGHAVVFGDSNKRNFDISNLLCITRAQLLKLNQLGLIQKDIDLTKTGITIADISLKIGERMKDKKAVK